MTETRRLLVLSGGHPYEADPFAEMLASFEGFHTDDIHTDLPQVKAATMLMTAGRGDVVLAQDVQEIRNLLPSVVTSHVANAGHMIPWDDEEGFYRAFGDFLGASLAAQ